MTELGNGDEVTVQCQLPNQATTAELLSRIVDGNAAWDELFRRYGELVAATVRSFRLQEADAVNAVQMTWWRLVESAHQMKAPERLGGWLATTARRECLHVLHQADRMSGTVTEPPAGSEQNHLRSDAEVAQTAGIQPKGIGPTRARVLRQLRGRLQEPELDSGNTNIEDVENETAEGSRTGSRLLDDLLDEAERALKKKLDKHKVTELTIGRAWTTGDAQLDDLLEKADTALRTAVATTERPALSLLGTEASLPPTTRYETARITPVDAEGVVDAAVRLLPTAWQSRYREEFRAELAELTLGERDEYARRVLTDALDLREELVKAG